MVRFFVVLMSVLWLISSPSPCNYFETTGSAVHFTRVYDFTTLNELMKKKKK